MEFLLFIIFFNLAIHLMAPSIFVGDTGEFCTTSVILGLAHSPGYPLFSLLGKLFTIIIPWGDMAYRINVMSVIFAALTGIVLFRLCSFILKGITGCKFISLTITFIFVFSFAFLKSSIQAEVFSLLSLSTVTIIYLLLIGGIRNYLISAFIFGLSCGNHHLIVFLLPFIFLFIIFHWGKIKNNIKQFSLIIILFLIGFSINLYLPIRSFKNPGFDWGNPENIRNFVRVLTRADYGTFRLTVSEGEKTPWTSQFIRFIRGINRDFGTIPTTLLFLLLFCAFKDYKISIPLFSSFFLTGPFFLILANQPFDAQSEGILERFFILPGLFLIILVCIGAKIILKKFNLIWLIFLLLPIISLLNNFHNKNLRNMYLAYDYGNNILRTLSHNAIFFMDGGDDTFYSMGYLCFAKGKRKDVELHDRGGLVFKNIYGADFRTLSRDEKEKRRNIIEASFLNIRPIFYSTFNEKILPGHNLYLAGVLYSTHDKKIDFFNFYSLRNLFGKKIKDYRTNALLPIYPYFIAKLHEKSNNLTSTIEAFKYTLQKYPEVLWVKSNVPFELHKIAYQQFNQANYHNAKIAYQLLLEFNPKDIDALLNLGVVEERLSNETEAEKLYMKALEIKPDNIQAYHNLGVIYWKRSDWKKVIECYNNVLKYDSQNHQAMHYIRIAQQNLKVTIH